MVFHTRRSGKNAFAFCFGAAVGRVNIRLIFEASASCRAPHGPSTASRCRPEVAARSGWTVSFRHQVFITVNHLSTARQLHCSQLQLRLR